MQSSWKYIVHGDITMVVLLSIILLWAIIHYINEIKRGEVANPFNSIISPKQR